jgi:hypothetical protein
MLVYKNGFYFSCKVKDLKHTLLALGNPELSVQEVLRLRLN